MPKVEFKNKRKAAQAIVTEEANQEANDASLVHPRRIAFPVVGIGASAGGLEAFSHLLAHLPPNSGLAYVLVQHLAPRHQSSLTELLSRTTKIPMREVRNGMAVERDHAYVIPPNTDMAIRNGVLHLMPRTGTQPHLPIDYFLRSLAEDRGGKAIGVILSGTASDGTLGMKAIKAEGGITFAQDERSAKYADMPRNAILSGCIDFVLPPEGIARELVRIAHHPYLRRAQDLEAGEISRGEDTLRKIFVLLRAATGVEFTNYKHTTIKRRIKRRMVLHKQQSLVEYLRFLEANRKELDALYQDILIHVTGFFRDPQMFEALKKTVYPAMLQNRPPDAPIRIWVPGCSTGEEVYSLAISLLEFLGNRAATADIQIFATDISDVALEKARVGLYLENILGDVSTERLRRFFVKGSNGYQISKSIREMCVFARQDITKDPPFSRLDLISCRNVLIYLNGNLQRKVVPVLHYALKPAGYLVLGSSETIGSFGDFFQLVDKKQKIYSKKVNASRPPLDFHRRDDWPEAHPASDEAPAAPTLFDAQREAERVLLAKYTPPGVVINNDMQIVQFRGRTGRYLEPPPGQATLSLPKMARDGLMVDIRAAVQKANREDAVVRRPGLVFHYDGQSQEVTVEVVPLKIPGMKDRYFLVLFNEPPVKAKAAQETREGRRRSSQEAEDRRVAQLKDDLAHTKSSLQSIIEEQETTNEELNSANEEVLSANEELQSTNEELETAKEELQSTNEELTTLNEELQNRNLELTTANSDLVNLLSSVNLPILMLSNDLHIRHATPAAEKLLNLIPTDVGRPVSDIKPNLRIEKFDDLISEAIDTVTVKEREVEDSHGRWYSMRVRPYKTVENKIDGAVVIWIDISTIKLNAELVASYALDLVDKIDASILVLDAHLRVKKANSTYYSTFETTADRTVNKFIYDLGRGRWSDPTLRRALEEVVPKHANLKDFELTEAGRGPRRRTLLSARRVDVQGLIMVLVTVKVSLE